MEYQFGSIEQKWRQWWNEQSVYKTEADPSKPKYYVLDMFPYPSGAGLHVGHPLGYIASDIYARYKRQCGYNVLHPMGFDAFGLPAEQYALETGQHPAVTTEQNIRRYREQLDLIGFSYDWDRSFRTSDPNYYKWTQWIFTKLFHSWFDRNAQKARPIEELIAVFEKEGNHSIPAPGDTSMQFSADEWKHFTEAERRNALMQYRLAYLDFAEVWWCEELGTVLANDEVINGVSERGGFVCVRRKMRQWSLRITEYAERLLSGLDTLDWTDGMKDMQRAWIGRSSGAQLSFDVEGSEEKITVFTTRPDTIFGADFIVLAPEHSLVDEITTDAQKETIAEYKAYVERRSERERMSEVKVVSGAFTGAYAQHPFTDRQLPIYIAEYVLAGYGTGAIMAVPSGDERDHLFAQHFNISITNIFGSLYTGESAYMDKSGKLEDSGFLSGMDVSQALEAAIQAIEAKGIGTRRVQYKLRDAGFSRQRYWGEPFPIIYQNDVPYTIDEPQLNLDAASRELPVELPFVESYRPGPEGQGPLANLTDWVETSAGRRETNTMPGYAGSSWYFLRYMDPQNNTEFADRKAVDYWNQVDVYVGGTEHAVGHLLYSRMWTKALCDLGYIGFDEPFKKLVNQGMIQGVSHFAFIKKDNLSNSTGDDVSNYDDADFEMKENGWEVPSKNPHSKRFVAKSNDVRRGLYSADSLSEEQHNWFVPFRISNQFVIYQGGKPYLDVEKASKSKDVKVQGVYIVSDSYSLDGINWLIDQNGTIGPERTFLLSTAPEKMSKSKGNVVNPDDIVAQYGADTFRLYEMFLGPIEASKPWDTQGIEGVHRFLRKLWRLFVSESGEWLPVADAATEAELRIIHKAIKKLGEDIERFGFNTCVSQLMICVNELGSLKCKSQEVLDMLVRAMASLAPHLAEELWHRLGNDTSVVFAPFPKWEERFIAESSKLYPVAINGKTRTELPFALDAAQEDIEREVLADETVLKWLEGKAPKKIVFVKGRMINVVV
jgi:leucyl-tRNA synthetase